MGSVRMMGLRYPAACCGVVQSVRSIQNVTGNRVRNPVSQPGLTLVPAEALTVFVKIVYEPGGDYFADESRLDEALRRDARG